MSIENQVCLVGIRKNKTLNTAMKKMMASGNAIFFIRFNIEDISTKVNRKDILSYGVRLKTEI